VSAIVVPPSSAAIDSIRPSVRPDARLPRTTPDPTNADRSRLTTLRIIWAALLMGQLMFLGVIMLVLWKRDPAAPRPDQRMLDILFYVSVALLLTAVPVGWFLRGHIFRAARERDGRSGVPGPAYVTGNIVFWAMCEGVSFLGLVGAMLNNGPWPHLVVPIIAMAVQAITFPTGAAMDENRI
jgi:hypothetical protein